jgi:hypothetical protein
MVDNNPFGTGGPKITRPPFIPAARSNVNLIDVITSTRNPSTGKFFQSKAAFDAFSEAEIGTSIGKKDGPKALQLLNKINKQSGGKGYVPISEAYKQMEESTLKTKNPKIKKAEGIKLANQLTSIQNEANKKFGKATTGPKVTWMKDTLKNAGITAKSVLKLGMKSILPALGPIGAILSVGMSKEVETGELSPEQQEEQQKYGAQYRMNRAGGGMMNMDEMTRPLGYAHGGMHYEHGGLHGPAGKTESEGRPYNEVLGRIMTEDEMRTDYAAPPPDPNDPDDLDMIINNMTFHVLHDKNRPMKEGITRENYFKLTNEEAISIADQLAGQLGISSDSPEYENIINKIMEQGEMINKIREEESQPVSTKFFKFLKDKVGMAGGGIAGYAGGGSLMGEMDDLKESLMKYEILDAHIGKRPPMSIIRKIDSLTGEALMDAYIEYGGTKYR